MRVLEFRRSSEKISSNPFSAPKSKERDLGFQSLSVSSSLTEVNCVIIRMIPKELVSRSSSLKVRLLQTISQNPNWVKIPSKKNFHE
jgi:hypothetical protein